MIIPAPFHKPILLRLLPLVLTLPVPLRAAGNAFYFFDESPDPRLTQDSSGEGNDFPYLGESTQTTEAAKFGEGSMALGGNKLMGFSGEIASSPLAGEISQMTISLWVMARNGDSTTSPIFFLQRLNGSTGGGHFTFNYDEIGKFSFYAEDLSESNAEGGKIVRIYSDPIPPFPGGEWTHVAMTFDRGEVVFYLNGQPVGDPHGLPEGQDAIRDIVGSDVGVFRGMVSSPGIQYVDDFGFFGNVALSPEDIQSLYEKGLKAFANSMK